MEPEEVNLRRIYNLQNSGALQVHAFHTPEEYRVYSMREKNFRLRRCLLKRASKAFHLQ